MCVEDRGTGDVIDDGTLAVRWADNRFPFWNALANTGVDASPGVLADTLSRAADYMRERKEPGLLWLFEDLLVSEARSDLPRAADQVGLRLALSGYGMAGDVLPLVEEPRHPELTFKRVVTEADVLAYAEINCRAYGFPLDAVEAGFGGSKIWAHPIRAYLGLREGAPVTAGATVEVDGCLFVILIATLPEFQRKGYGEAVTRRALYEGARGTDLRRATLHATLAGAPVYERIGLRKVGSISFYGLK